MLRSLATIATCTVADCEVRHSHHQHLLRSASVGAARTIGNLCSNSINDAARMIRMHVEQDAYELSKRLYHKAQHFHHHQEHVSVESNATRSNASAISVFRKGFIHGQNRALGMKRNWMTKDAWKEVKDAFNSLPEDTRSNFAALAQSRNDMIEKRAKRERLAIAAAESSQFQSSAAVVGQSAAESIVPVNESLALPLGESGDQPRPLNALLGSLDYKILQNNMKDVDTFWLHLTRQHEHLISKYSKRDSPKSPPKNVWPIDENNILTALLGIRCTRRTLKDCCQVFQTFSKVQFSLFVSFSFTDINFFAEAYYVFISI